jgi:hypothetical protein
VKSVSVKIVRVSTERDNTRKLGGIKGVLALGRSVASFDSRLFYGGLFGSGLLGGFGGFRGFSHGKKVIG